MLAGWVVGGTVAAGLALGAFYLAGRRLPPWGRLAGWLHGAAGALGTGLAVAAWQGGLDVKGSGGLAAGFLVAALLGGAVVGLAHVRGRTASGLAVTLHAVFGLGGFLLLLAWGGG